MTIGKTATRSDWRARRGEACVAQAPKSFRPPLQAEPSGGTPCRVFSEPAGPDREHARREPFSGGAVGIRRGPGVIRVYCHFSFCFPGSVITFASSGSAGSSSGSAAPISFAASSG